MYCTTVPSHSTVQLAVKWVSCQNDKWLWHVKLILYILSVNWAAKALVLLKPWTLSCQSLKYRPWSKLLFKYSTSYMSLRCYRSVGLTVYIAGDFHMFSLCWSPVSCLKHIGTCSPAITGCRLLLFETQVNLLTSSIIQIY